jgi:hypothetical protein
MASCKSLHEGGRAIPLFPPHLPPFSFLLCCSSPSSPLRTHAQLVCRAQIIFPASATAYAPCPSPSPDPAPSPSPASAPAPAPATTPAPAPDPSLALLPQFLFLIMLLLSQHKKKRLPCSKQMCAAHRRSLPCVSRFTTKITVENFSD